MESIHDIEAGYARRAAREEQRQNRLTRLINAASLTRLCVVVAYGAALAVCRQESVWTLACITAVALLLFAWLVKRHDRLFRQRDFAARMAQANHEELAALQGDIAAFDDGSGHADSSHLYTYDLDVFGPHSLFQCINRTCTPMGDLRLARWLNRHLTDKDRIVRRQEAIAELAGQTDFRLQFRVTGLLSPGKATDEAALRTWAGSPSVFRRRRLLRLLPGLATGINAACLALWLGGVLPGALWALVWTGILFAAIGFTGHISRVLAVHGRQMQILGTYARLIGMIDRYEARSSLLQEVKASLHSDGQPASAAIARLDKLMGQLDQRNNYLAYALLNGTFFWELWQMMRVEQWKERHAAHLPHWLDALGRADALLSLATFAYNHPDYTFPAILDRDEAAIEADNGLPFRLKAEGMGHPLMDPDRCVRNDIALERRPGFIVITGANMAGKSTYLRTVGVNLLLACTGAPVCARRMEVYPVRLVTSLRTTDSLKDNESYFFAELKRLKLIIDMLQQGEKLFIILDEILKGTNSTDKQRGSLALVRQFVGLKGNGIIATHDLQLGGLADIYPGQVGNFCFEADIVDNRLSFSYHMRPGVARNMNACFLMQQMGIRVDS